MSSEQASSTMRYFNRVREFRKARGMTQKELAQASRVNQGWLSKIENGEANYTADSFFAIASALDVPAWQLIKPEGEEFTGTNLMMEGG